MTIGEKLAGLAKATGLCDSPEEALRECDFSGDLRETQTDEGIGPYEFWGQTGFDSRPCTEVEGNGEITISWFDTDSGEPEVPEMLTISACSTNDISVNILGNLKGEPSIEKETAVIGGVEVSYWRITASYSWTGEGSGEGMTEEDDCDARFDRERDEQKDRDFDDYAGPDD